MANESFEFLTPGTTQAVIDGVKDYVAIHAAQPEVASGTEDEAAWLTRETAAGFPCGGRATVKAIKGKTVKWNQIVANGDFADSSEWLKASTYFNWETSNNTAVLTATDGGHAIGLVGTVALVDGHKYYGSCLAKTSGANALYMSLSGNSGTDNGIAKNVQLSGTFQKVSGIVAYSEPSSAANRLRIATAAASTASGDVLTLANVQLFDLTLMFGAGNEPSTVAEFERMYPESYYPYSAPTLQSAKPTGIESVGFNLFDRYTAIAGTIYGASDGARTSRAACFCSDHIPVLPHTTYYTNADAHDNTYTVHLFDADKRWLGKYGSMATAGTFDSGNASYVGINCVTANVSPDELVVNLSGTRNGEYEPHWSQSISIPIDQIAPNGLRSAGSGSSEVCDELTASELVTRVGVVDLGTLTWTKIGSLTDGTGSRFQAELAGATVAFNTIGCACAELTPVPLPASYSSISLGQVFKTTSNVQVGGDSNLTAAQFKVSLAGVYLFYELATPTTTPIDPPLNFTYRCAAGGTETVTHTEATSAPTLDVVYEIDHTAAAASIAPLEGRIASTNYSLGALIMLGGTLVKVTTAIATGEQIILGQNVAATTVAAELAALA